MLEQELAQKLRPVKAPPELWDRVSGAAGRPPRSAAANLTLALAVAATVLLAIIAWGMRPQSADPAQVRAWVRTNAGLDLPLAPRPGLRLTGAHAARDRADLEFVVDGREGKLVVARAPGSTGDSHVLPGPDAKVYSWKMRGLAFQLECAGPADLRAACALCHS